MYKGRRPRDAAFKDPLGLLELAKQRLAEIETLDGNVVAQQGK